MLLFTASAYIIFTILAQYEYELLVLYNTTIKFGDMYRSPQNFRVKTSRKLILNLKKCQRMHMREPWHVAIFFVLHSLKCYATYIGQTLRTKEHEMLYII